MKSKIWVQKHYCTEPDESISQPYILPLKRAI